MTIQEASERYNIPFEVLQEYESWRPCGADGHRAGARQYDDADLERLGLMMTLRGAGLEAPEIEAYMRLMEQGETEAQRLQMLDQKRQSALREIHLREKQLERLDYLRHCLGQQRKK